MLHDWAYKVTADNLYDSEYITWSEYADIIRSIKDDLIERHVTRLRAHIRGSKSRVRQALVGRSSPSETFTKKSDIERVRRARDQYRAAYGNFKQAKTELQKIVKNAGKQTGIQNNKAATLLKQTRFIQASQSTVSI